MNKQIEEMARELAENLAWDEDEIPTVDCLETAKRLYIEGYRKKNEWIPIMEKLPTEDDANADNAVLAIHKRSVKRYFHWKSVADNPFDFTYWMPLPEPPETEKGGAE